ncbi:MAG: winged helix-turn-helix domain-containing protein [Acidobacteriaceae bacterium]|nr:winged helix-turn-helix domain-containing protein [Acidobacteriaceae bacterium]
MDVAGLAEDSKDRTVAQFGPFEFCFRTGELRKHGVRVRLQGKPAQLLHALIEHPGQVITRDQLKDKLWSSDIFVDFESGLNTAANRLRFALGDSAERPIYIETLPKIGYRFVAPVTVIASSKSAVETEMVKLEPSVPVTVPIPVSQPLIQAPQNQRTWRRPAVLVAAACMLLGSAVFFHLSTPRTTPVFRQVTFSRGLVNAARFTPDGKAIVYSAAWSGAPSRVFLQKGVSPESELLNKGPAWLTSISPEGEAAIFRHSPDDRRVILESLPLRGGAAVPLSDRAKGADWGPNGSLGLILADSSGYSVNYPKDRTLYKSAGRISVVRVSRNGHQVAFLEHPLESDDAGQVVVVDMTGHARILSSGWASLAGLAWHPSKGEVWFTAARSGVNRALMAADLKGNVRQVAQIPGGMVLQDINAQGDVLIARTNPRTAMFWGNLESGSTEDISLFDWSRAVALKPDGRLLLFDESGEGGGRQYSLYLYYTASRRPERLGEGRAMDLSDDGHWVLAQVANDPSRVTLVSVDQHKSSAVFTDGLIYQWAKFFPNSGCPEILLGASQPGHTLQLYRQRLPGGHPQPIPSKAEINDVIINDGGNLIAGLDEELRISVLDLRTGAIRSVNNPQFVVPVRFMSGNQILTSHYDNGVITLNTLDTTNGEMRLYRRLEMGDNTGTAHISPLRVTRDMKRFVYSRSQTLSDLFTVSGWN